MTQIHPGRRTPAALIASANPLIDVRTDGSALGVDRRGAGAWRSEQGRAGRLSRALAWAAVAVALAIGGVGCHRAAEFESCAPGTYGQSVHTMAGPFGSFKPSYDSNNRCSLAEDLSLGLKLKVDEGTKLYVRGKRWKKDKEGVYRLDLATAIGQVPASTLENRDSRSLPPLRIPVAVKASGGEKEEGTLTLMIGDIWWGSIIKGMIQALPLDEKFKGSKSSLLFTNDGFSHFKMLGKKPSKIGGFRYFAIGRNIGEERKEGCGLYEGGASVTLSYQDKEVIVIDARTGKEVARKTFSPAKRTCPSYTTGGGSTVSSAVEPGDVEPWLDEIRKR